MNQRTFTGFLHTGEIFEDIRVNYREKMREEDPSSDEYKNAFRQLELLEQFPPGVPHDRLVAHKVNVYEITEPRWHRMKSCLLMPLGRMRRVYSADLGEMLIKARVDENDLISVGLSSEGTLLKYSAVIGGVQITADKPLEFRFRQYISIDGVETGEPWQTDVARPLFSIDYNKALQIPGKMMGFGYSKSSVRIKGE